jgi:hypothetical protein
VPQNNNVKVKKKSMETNKNKVVTRTVISGQMEGSRKYLRPKVNQLESNFNWGKIIRKLLKTKKN